MRTKVTLSYCSQITYAVEYFSVTQRKWITVQVFDVKERELAIQVARDISYYTSLRERSELKDGSDHNEDVIIYTSWECSE